MVNVRRHAERDAAARRHGQGLGRGGSRLELVARHGGGGYVCHGPVGLVVLGAPDAGPVCAAGGAVGGGDAGDGVCCDVSGCPYSFLIVGDWRWKIGGPACG